MEYKNTIITPKTGFPMKAGLPAREPGMLKAWEEQDLYNAMLEKNKDLPPFVLHDGPPFSNGYIHMGHALNKALKDFIVRSHAMMGFYTPYVPGWDNHGLPIERAIETSKKKLNKDMTASRSRWAASSVWALWAIGSIPTAPWISISRHRKSRSLAACSTRAISTRV